jgi:hypothetical protein
MLVFKRCLYIKAKEKYTCVTKKCVAVSGQHRNFVAAEI